MTEDRYNFATAHTLDVGDTGCLHCGGLVTQAIPLIEHPDVGPDEVVPPGRVVAWLLVPCLHTVEGVRMCAGPPRVIGFRDDREAVT